LLELPLSNGVGIWSGSQENFSVNRAGFICRLHSESRQVKDWLAKASVTLDGIIAKRRDLNYRSG
jgi:hypothetical protein